MVSSPLTAIGVTLSVSFSVAASVECPPVAATLAPPPAAAGKFGFSMAGQGGVLAVRNELGSKGAPLHEAIVLVSGVAASIEHALYFSVNEFDSGTAPTFGHSVAMGNGWVAAASFESGVATFREIGGVWSQGETLQQPGGDDPNSYFGYAVAASGQRLAVGEISEGSALGTRVWMYEWQNESWQVQEVLEDPGAAWFGASISMEGDWLFVGAPDASDGAGQVLVYWYDGMSWTHMQDLVPTGHDPETHDGRFGSRMTVHGDILVVAAWSDWPTGLESAVYIYHRDGHVWDEVDVLTSPTGDDTNEFGLSAALQEEYLAIGGWSNSGDDGRVHFYELADTGVASYLETVVTPITGPHIYGVSMAFLGESLIVGRPWGAGSFNGVCDVLHLPNTDASLDCNGNGICDGDDVLAGVSFDCDGDGILDECDYDACECPDASGDGLVGSDDLLLVLSQWGSCISGGCSADFDGDGVVGVNDLLRVVKQWGECG